MKLVKLDCSVRKVEIAPWNDALVVIALRDSGDDPISFCAPRMFSGQFPLGARVDVEVTVQAGAATGGEPGAEKASAAAPVYCSDTCCALCRHEDRGTCFVHAGPSFLCPWATSQPCGRQVPGYPCPKFSPEEPRK